MKPRYFASIALALTLSLSGCKQSYSSLSSDPQKRIQEVRSCKSSEVLAQVLIFEKTPEIYDIADRKLVDRSYIKKEISKLSQSELLNVILDNSSTLASYVNGIKFDCIGALNDQALLAEAALKCKTPLLCEQSIQKIKDKKLILELIVNPLFENRKLVEMNKFSKEERINLMKDRSLLKIEDFYNDGYIYDFSSDEILDALKNDINPEARKMINYKMYNTFREAMPEDKNYSKIEAAAIDAVKIQEGKVLNDETINAINEIRQLKISRDKNAKQEEQERRDAENELKASEKLNN